MNGVVLAATYVPGLALRRYQQRFWNIAALRSIMPDTKENGARGAVFVVLPTDYWQVIVAVLITLPLLTVSVIVPVADAAGITTWIDPDLSTVGCDTAGLNIAA